jgi:myo-inositol 2-dehydrogenase/D-chiro-inositol 1-dehydrogenase
MTLQLGFVGAGPRAWRHFVALDSVPDSRVVACADLDLDLAARAAARYAGAAAHRDGVAMVTEERLDAVYVCLAPEHQRPLVDVLAERRIPFFVDAPVGTGDSGAHADAPLEVPPDLITSVGYETRYRQNVDRLRSHLAGRTPLVARGLVPAAAPAQPGREDATGSTAPAAHLLDLLRYLLGEAQSVLAVPGPVAGLTAAWIVSLADGSVCSVLRAGQGVGADCSLEVFGRDLHARLAGQGADLLLRTPGEEHRFTPADDPVLTQDRAFIQAVLAGDPSAIRSPLHDALRTGALVRALQESALRGAPAHV